MTYLFLVGRIILGVFFLYNGYNHFKGHKGMVAYAKSMHAPMPELTVPLTGLLLLVAGASFLTGLYPQVGVAASVAFFIPVTFMMHAFWKIPDPQMASAQKIQFLKNMAILGATLMLLAIPEPWAMSLSL